MDYLRKINSNFIRDISASSKLDANPYTSIPTIIFLLCTFVLLYLQFHRYTFPTTRWKTRLYKDVVFHWSYFYIVRIWFLMLKFGRYIISVIDDYISMTSPKDEVFINQTINHSLIFMFILMISIIPLLILSVHQIYSRDMPNFLMWVAEDPWIRSEIGTSGHYLERPAQIGPSYKNRNSAYRSRRSTSVDADIFENKQSTNVRFCKSMMIVNVVKSIDDMAE